MKTINIKKEFAKLKKEKSIKQIASEIGISVSSLYRFFQWEYTVGYKVWNKILCYIAPPYFSDSRIYVGNEGFIFKVCCSWMDAWTVTHSIYKFDMRLKFFEYSGSLFNHVLDEFVYVYDKEDYYRYAEDVVFCLNSKKQFNRFYA